MPNNLEIGFINFDPRRGSNEEGFNAFLRDADCRMRSNENINNDKKILLPNIIDGKIILNNYGGGRESLNINNFMPDSDTSSRIIERFIERTLGSGDTLNIPSTNIINIDPFGLSLPRRLPEITNVFVELTPEEQELRKYPLFVAHGTGLSAQLGRSRDEIFVANKKVCQRGDLVVNMDFTPEHTIKPNPQKRLQFMASGITGIEKFVEAVENDRLPRNYPIYGRTNYTMAVIAQRLGFEIEDECRNRDGSIKKDLNSYVIVAASFETIKEKVAEYKARGKRVQERCDRELERKRLRPSFGQA